MDRKLPGIILFVAFVSVSLPLASQTTWCWKAANLGIDIPFHADSIMVEEDSTEFWLDADVLEMELLLIPKDSLDVNTADIYQSMLDAIVKEYELVVLSNAKKMKGIPEGTYLTALDTLVFTDTVVVMAFPGPSGLVFAGVIDCYEVPLHIGVTLANSFRFNAPACKQEE
ncbi:MAG: hypothetical protein R6V49_03080 [Bacteroidales bacterium]